MLTNPTADRPRSSNHIRARCLKPGQFFWPTTNSLGTLYSSLMMNTPVIRLFSKVRYVLRSKHMPYTGLPVVLGVVVIANIWITLSGLSDKLPKPINSTPITWICSLLSTPTSISRLSLNVTFLGTLKRDFFTGILFIFLKHFYLL